MIPWLLTGWRERVPPPHPTIRLAGLVLIVVGAAVLLSAFARFVLEGSGTPAPVAPTQKLVVGGLYRYVRNPMYLAVAATIVGQALLLGRLELLAYTAVFLATCSLVRGARAAGAVRSPVRGVPTCGPGMVAAPSAVDVAVDRRDAAVLARPN